MNRLVAMVATVGDATDTVLGAVRATPGHVRAALSQRRNRRIALAGGGAALLLYTWAIGDLVIGAAGRGSGGGLVPGWPERIFRPRAPYLFEPVLAAYPLPGLAVLVSPVNLALGGLLAALVGLNLAVARHAGDRTVACRPRGYGRLLGLLPALLTGMACCVPTLLVALGTGTAAVVLPVALPLRAVFYPLSATLLAATLVWGARQMPAPRPVEGDAAPRPVEVDTVET